MEKQKDKVQEDESKEGFFPMENEPYSQDMPEFHNCRVKYKISIPGLNILSGWGLGVDVVGA